MKGICHLQENVGIKVSPAALTDGSPSQIRHSKFQLGRANDPQLRHSNDFVISLQNQMAEMFLVPANSTVGSGLVDVGIVEKVEHLRPFGRRSTIHLNMPNRVHVKLACAISTHSGYYTAHD